VAEKRPEAIAADLPEFTAVIAVAVAAGPHAVSEGILTTAAVQPSYRAKFRIGHLSVPSAARRPRHLRFGAFRRRIPEGRSGGKACADSRAGAGRHAPQRLLRYQHIPYPSAWTTSRRPAAKKGSPG
jgi:hypothetical protein